MGCVVTSKNKEDMDVPRSAPNTYPKNPCYANSPYNGAPAPVIAMPGGGGQTEFLQGGDIMLAGAAMHHHGVGIPGPGVYNSMSGGYQAL